MDIETLREPSRRLIEAALASDIGYRRLGWLCDRIGARLSGSRALDAAILWAVSELKSDGFDSVRAERVMVPRWVRGKESAMLLSPVQRPLSMLGLGGSVGGDVRAEVLVVSSFEELKTRAGEARGKIICYNVPFTDYGATVRYRTGGASEAAKVGGVAALVRSVGPASLKTPHTGVMHYAEGIPKIPTAAVAIEDAELLARCQARGEKPVVRLQMGARTLKDSPSANVIADFRGREKPDEIVLLGGHLDSWDVGQGAHDDGGGCLMCWEAVRLMKVLNLRPKRTVRLVLFTNEENGTAGGKAYAAAHGTEPHVLAVEADAGAGEPLGFGLSTKTPGGLERAQALSALGIGPVTAGGGGADIGALGERGVPTAGLKNDMSLYWNIHHTPADTFEKIDPKALARCTASLAVFVYAAAEGEEKI